MKKSNVSIRNDLQVDCEKETATEIEGQGLGRMLRNNYYKQQSLRNMLRHGLLGIQHNAEHNVGYW